MSIFDVGGASNSGIFGTGAGVGSAVSDIFGGIGDLMEGSSYGEAARIAMQNAGIAQNSGKIQLMQAQRQITQTIGAQKTEIAGAGLKQSGSALNIYSASMAQGNLTKQLIHQQTNINVGGFEQEASAYHGMQDAADASGIGNILGGSLKFFGL